MNAEKSKRKKIDCIKHREERYEHAIQKVIDGEADGSYATERWKKLKQVRKRK